MPGGMPERSCNDLNTESATNKVGPGFQSKLARHAWAFEMTAPSFEKIVGKTGRRQARVAPRKPSYELRVIRPERDDASLEGTSSLHTGTGNALGEP
jgi:hypothetical protein